LQICKVISLDSYPQTDIIVINKRLRGNRKNKQEKEKKMNTLTDFVNALENAEEPKFNIVPRSLIFEKVGDAHKVYFLRMDTFSEKNRETGEMKEKPEAIFTDGKNVFFSVTTVLVSEIMRRKIPSGAPLKIVFSGEIQNKGGKNPTKLFDIFPLNIPPFELRDNKGNLLPLSFEQPEPRSLIQPGQSMSLDQALEVEFVDDDGAYVKLASIAEDADRLTGIREYHPIPRVREAAGMVLADTRRRAETAE